MRSSNIVTALAGFITLGYALPGENLFNRAACARDNCARQVAPSPTKSVNQADCSSFLARTVTTCSAGVSPCTTTLAPTPTSVPKYASACSSNASKYASACSCAGLTGSTSTVTATRSASTPGVTAILLQIGAGPTFEAFNQPVLPVLYGSQYMVQATDGNYQPFYLNTTAGGLLSPIADLSKNTFYCTGISNGQVAGDLFAYPGSLPRVYCSLGANNQFSCTAGSSAKAFYKDCHSYISYGFPTDTDCQAADITQINIIYQIVQG